MTLERFAASLFFSLILHSVETRAACGKADWFCAAQEVLSNDVLYGRVDCWRLDAEFQRMGGTRA